MKSFIIGISDSEGLTVRYGSIYSNKEEAMEVCNHLNKTSRAERSSEYVVLCFEYGTVQRTMKGEE